MTLLDHLPRFSAADDGEVGEGTLDPMGLGAAADRIADLLAPGLRARMINPRFVTLAAIGAKAWQNAPAIDGSFSTRPDIAFEWIVTEALARNQPGTGEAHVFPGSRKVNRAIRRGDRVSAADYLASPRVFGFTGVYRPYSKYAGVIDDREELTATADRLIEA